MACEFNSLLPHPTDVELAIEHEASEKYCRADPAVIRQLYDPMECPAELLPWMAYALSVDVWNPRWPDSTKRAVCSNSLQMHLHKGTVGGVTEALAALGITVEIVEWWQMQPEGEPGTMQVTLNVNNVINHEADIILSAEMVRDVLEQLERSKRASIHYTFTLAVEASPVTVGMGMSGQMTALQRLGATHNNTAATSQPVTVGMGMTGQMTALQRLDSTHNNTAATSQPISVGLGMSGQMTALQRTTVAQNQTASHATYTPVIGMSAQLSTLHHIEARL